MAKAHLTPGKARARSPHAPGPFESCDRGQAAARRAPLQHAFPGQRSRPTELLHHPGQRRRPGWSRRGWAPSWDLPRQPRPAQRLQGRGNGIRTAGVAVGGGGNRAAAGGAGGGGSARQARSLRFQGARRAGCTGLPLPAPGQLVGIQQPELALHKESVHLQTPFLVGHLPRLQTSSLALESGFLKQGAHMLLRGVGGQEGAMAPRSRPGQGGAHAHRHVLPSPPLSLHTPPLLLPTSVK